MFSISHSNTKSLNEKVNSLYLFIFNKEKFTRLLLGLASAQWQSQEFNQGGSKLKAQKNNFKVIKF